MTLFGFGENERNLCERQFVLSSWQLVHSINFEMGNGQGSTVLGVTVIKDGRVKTALMGVEGFVLFEAEEKEDGSLNVLRALPPFDKDDFAESLIRDVRLLFLPPGYLSMLFGKISSGETVCRYIQKNGDVSDVTTGKGWYNRIEVFNRHDELIRLVTADNFTTIDDTAMPGVIHSEVFRGDKARRTLFVTPGYKLHMKLLSAGKL